MPTDERIERIRVALEATFPNLFPAADALADLASLAADVAALVDAARGRLPPHNMLCPTLRGEDRCICDDPLRAALARFGPQQQEKTND